MILSPGVPVTQAVTKGTASIPVLATVPDLVASGFVESLARPGGNVTGISLQAGVALSEKWLELLKETFPHVRKVAVLAISPSSPYIDRIAEVGPVLAVEPVVYSAKDSDELERALLAIATNLPDGLVVAPDATLISNRARIIAFASEHRLPTVYGNLDFVPDGGLMAYFTNITAAWRRLATYVEKALEGRTTERTSGRAGDDVPIARQFKDGESPRIDDPAHASRPRRRGNRMRQRELGGAVGWPPRFPSSCGPTR